MSLLRWTPAAAEDLQAISAYLEQQRGIATANRVCRTIYDELQQLRRFPGSGRIGATPGTYELVLPALPTYIAVYRLAANDTVELLRIWHGAQRRSVVQ